jgi:uncharacterized protein with PQ loop repeat
MIEFIGLVGSVCFSISGVPQLVKSFKDGHSKGMSHGTLWLWIIGELAMLYYSYSKYPSDYILIGNYLFNLIIVSMIAKYKYAPRKIEI